MITILTALTVAATAAAFDPDDPVAQMGVQRTVVAEGLEHPWGLTFLPDGRALVTERPGRLRIMAANGALSAPVAGVPAPLVHGQGGLLDVAAAPDFARSRVVYLSLSVGTPEANRVRVVRGVLDGETLTGVTTVLENPLAKPGGQHFGSRFAWAPDGALLVSVGDGGNPPVRVGEVFVRTKAQDREAWFGKVLRVEAPASANPRVRVWTLGHRNIQGLAIDPKTKAVWATEHGARGGDELNRLVAGGNHGWPAVTHSTEYWGPKISEATSGPGFTDPTLVWKRATAPSGLAIYRGTAFKEWQGDILAGGLLSQDVRRISVDAQGRVTGQTRIGINARVRDVRVGPDGLIYVLTDEKAGRLIRLSPAS